MVNWDPAPRDVLNLEKVADAIRRADDWLIVTHERPDGDAIGSSLAIAHLLQALGKTWCFITGEPLPSRFSYLSLFDRAQTAGKAPNRQYTHVVAVDCADEARFLEVRAYIAKDAQIVNIDHHRTNPHYGVAAMVDEEAAATCELIYHVVRCLDVPLKKDISECLYTGLLTDTGGFSLPNTTRDVHQIAAELLSSGVKPYDVSEPAMESRSLAQLKLLQKSLASVTVSDDGSIAVIEVTRGMLREVGATDDDVEGLVGFARSIDTTEVGILLKETKDGRVKVSLRSKRKIDVAAVAQKFSGGGHMRAAGCTLSGGLEAAKDQVLQEVERALAEARE